MSLDVAPPAHRTMPPTPPATAPHLTRDQLLDRFNQAVRQPARFGGVAELGRLLDQLAAAEDRGEPKMWIPDTNARLNPSGFFREFFGDPEIHVVASQHGEDAFRRGGCAWTGHWTARSSAAWLTAWCPGRLPITTSTTSSPNTDLPR